MWVHVGRKFLHTKFHDPDGHRMADMTKKPKFWIFWVFFLGFFAKKTVVNIQAGIQNFA